MNLTPRTNGIVAAGGVLDRIIDAKRVRLDDLKRLQSISDQRARASDRQDRHSLTQALCATERVNIIAEIKHRSPSRGVIRDLVDPAGIGSSYQSGGAVALSVLTEEDFFGGSLGHLLALRESVDLPLLRKDFIFDPFQVYEAVANGADAILLIVAVLDDVLLSELIALASETRLDALVEVHTAEEMERASHANARLIGVNNRDLTTFKVDLSTSEKLRSLAPEGAILVAESGINTGSDIKRLKSAGYSGFLVGEHLMKAPDPGLALRRLISEAES